eukprot:CAMPEP_0201152438 /NCGR_PEP_ID=MMETSP0851-20130426/13109_1 /ASSEMBLY_ACC=CAM_ASM_000631 /TAXON_ID=183588 /ORGANISM="Pseudo-nitzschia fraudulenta, Strain WWA7" /LENGTH=453 /DNA_ID=CAMNT_0047429455 /DNA_START=378 /DNA_END=1739 /DNA_ORIENTATION=+
MLTRAGVNETSIGDDLLRQSPSTLFSVAFLDRLRLLYPRTWWGIVDFEDSKSASAFEISSMVNSAVGLVLPFLVLWTAQWALNEVFFRQRQSVAGIATIPRMLLKRLFVVSFVSPWCVQCFYQLFFQLSVLLESIRAIAKNRSSTLTRATDALKLRIRHQRAYRTRRYDVYLPTSLAGESESDQTSSDSNNDSKTLRGLLFLPGASVSHEAYSEVAARLSDEGFLVAVVSLEPLRLALNHLGTSVESVKRVIETISSQIHAHALAEIQQRDDNYTASTLPEEVLPAQTLEWTLIGHSMGSFAAMKLLSEFFSEQHVGNNPKQREIVVRRRSNSSSNNSSSKTFSVLIGNKLVMWGAAAFVDAATDLSGYEKSRVLVVQGTKDKFVELMRSRHDEFLSYFPPTNTQTERIAGGTHEGFGSYDPSFKFGDEDDEHVSIDWQHKKACDATVRFLRS